MANIHISNKKVKTSDKEGQGIDKAKYDAGYERIFGKQTIEERIEIAKKNAGRQEDRKKIVIAQSDSKNFTSTSAGVGLEQTVEYQKFIDSHGIGAKVDKNTGDIKFRTRNDKLNYLKELSKATGRHIYDCHETRG
jgi:hypothetical protein